LWAGRVAFQLVPELCHVDAKLMGLVGVVRAPHFMHQLAMGHHPAGMARSL